MLTEKTKAPEIELENQDGEIVRLSDYLGKWVLVYFYPKDDTPGCTKEACGLRDNYQDLSENLAILGISRDSVKSHAKFKEKYDLPFDLLSDPDAGVIKKYEAWGIKKFMGKEYEGILRVSYLIDPEGKIAKAYPKVKPAEHAKDIMSDLNSLMKN